MRLKTFLKDFAQNVYDVLVWDALPVPKLVDDLEDPASAPTPSLTIDLTEVFFDPSSWGQHGRLKTFYESKILIIAEDNIEDYAEALIKSLAYKRHADAVVIDEVKRLDIGRLEGTSLKAATLTMGGRAELNIE